MIEVRKVRGKNAIKPIRISQTYALFIRSKGLSLEAFIREYVAVIAKKRKWSWYFEKESEK
jgi:hypothetical protein